jgi:hypothetical protein
VAQPSCSVRVTVSPDNAYPLLLHKSLHHLFDMLRAQEALRGRIGSER